LRSLETRCLRPYRLSRPQPATDPTNGRDLVFHEGLVIPDAATWFASPKPSTLGGGSYGRSAFSGITGDEGFRLRTH
jgi:hypothetical protein